MNKRYMLEAQCDLLNRWVAQNLFTNAYAWHLVNQDGDPMLTRMTHHKEYWLNIEHVEGEGFVLWLRQWRPSGRLVAEAKIGAYKYALALATSILAYDNDEIDPVWSVITPEVEAAPIQIHYHMGWGILDDAKHETFIVTEGDSQVISFQLNDGTTPFIAGVALSHDRISFGYWDDEGEWISATEVPVNPAQVKSK